MKNCKKILRIIGALAAVAAVCMVAVLFLRRDADENKSENKSVSIVESNDWIEVPSEPEPLSYGAGNRYNPLIINYESADYFTLYFNGDIEGDRHLMVKVGHNVPEKNEYGYVVYNGDEIYIGCTHLKDFLTVIGWKDGHICAAGLVRLYGIDGNINSYGALENCYLVDDYEKYDSDAVLAGLEKLREEVFDDYMTREEIESYDLMLEERTGHVECESFVNLPKEYIFDISSQSYNPITVDMEGADSYAVSVNSIDGELSGEYCLDGNNKVKKNEYGYIFSKDSKIHITKAYNSNVITVLAFNDGHIIGAAFLSVEIKEDKAYAHLEKCYGYKYEYKNSDGEYMYVTLDDIALLREAVMDNLK